MPEKLPRTCSRHIALTFTNICAHGEERSLAVHVISIIHSGGSRRTNELQLKVSLSALIKNQCVRKAPDAARGSATVVACRYPQSEGSPPHQDSCLTWTGSVPALLACSKGLRLIPSYRPSHIGFMPPLQLAKLLLRQLTP